MSMETIRFQWRSRPGSPLLMHNVRLANPLDPVVRAIKKLTAKKTKKTDDDIEEIARLEFVGGLYYDDDVGPYLPAQNVIKCLVEAARMLRLGKQIERGVIAGDARFTLAYHGPRTPEEMWEKRGEFADTRAVGNKNVTVQRTRPRFNTWSADVELLVDTTVVDVEQVIHIADLAGQRVGICERYGGWGRFVSKAVDTSAD